MFQHTTFKNRQWYTFIGVVVFAIVLLVLDLSITYSGSAFLSYKHVHWMGKMNNNEATFSDITQNTSLRKMQIVKMGKQTWNVLSESAGNVRAALYDNKLLEAIESLKYSHTNHPTTTEDVADITESFVFTSPPSLYKFPIIPGLLSMDKDLSLPPEVPLRPDSKEPILQYSQRRDYASKISHSDRCGAGGVANLNLTDFDFKNNVFLLMIIKSSCNLQSRRNAVRSTWGNETWVKDKLGIQMRRFFIIGQCESYSLQDHLVEEDKEHNDILQWDFFDSFRNLTLKDCLFLQWFSRHCRNVPFIFKGDDDTFVNLPNVVKILKNLPLEKRKNLFRGSALKGSPRILNPSWKYYVSYNLYPKEIYPPYVSGGGFIMSGHMAVQLFQASLSTRIIPIDDAFLGILLKKIGVSPENDRGFKNWGLRKYDICRIAKINTFHKMLPEDLPTVWREYLALDVAKCNNETDDVFLSQMKR